MSSTTEWVAFPEGEATDRAGQPVYPSRLGLWLEFASHFGWAWTLPVAGGSGRGGCVSRGDGCDRAPAADGRSALVALLALWVLLGAAAFTATDWRQTKHLSLLAPALALLGAALLRGQPSALRWGIRAALGISLVFNAIWIARLAADFESMTVSTIW